MLGLIDPAVIGGTLAALAAGRWIGKRTIARYGPSAAPALGSLETAGFALLGLMIAFTFSGALSRFDTRRAQIVDEANAMGTAYLRIDLVPAAAQPKRRETFRAYVDSRIETYRRLPDIAEAKAELEHTQALQGEVWSQAIAAGRLPGSPPAAEGVLLNAFKGLFNIIPITTPATMVTT